MRVTKIFFSNFKLYRGISAADLLNFIFTSKNMIIINTKVSSAQIVATKKPT